MTATAGRTLFVTGTDTGVGKTTIACGLLRQARQQGIRACGFKPVATGASSTAGGLRNDDALALQAAAAVDEDYARLNPYAFAPAIAPHLAATEAGLRIRPAHLSEVHAGLAARHELVIVEGAGGWLVPLDEVWTMAEWVAEQEWPVLLVVGMRLGCLNHALLSAEAVMRRTRLAGWVANVLPPEQERLAANIASLQTRMPAPCWGVVPAHATDAAAHLEVDWPAFMAQPTEDGSAAP